MAEHFALVLVADAAPELANSAFGNAAHAAIAVNERSAKHGVRLIVAQETQGENGCPARNVVADGNEPLECRTRIAAGDAFDEQAAVLVREVAVVIDDQYRGAYA